MNIKLCKKKDYVNIFCIHLYLGLLHCINMRFTVNYINFPVTFVKRKLNHVPLILQGSKKGNLAMTKALQSQDGVGLVKEEANEEPKK